MLVGPLTRTRPAAASNAGIPSSHTQLALEPEAAALDLSLQYSKTLREEKGAPGCAFWKLALALMDIGSAGEETWSTMVIDCGGGTIDITVLQARADGSFIQLDKDGSDQGSTRIDLAFVTLMRRVFGPDLLAKILVGSVRRSG